MGYAAIDIEGQVPNCVFSAKGLAEHWTKPDEFEYEAYSQMLVKAELEISEIIKGWVYALHPSLI